MGEGGRVVKQEQERPMGTMYVANRGREGLFQQFEPIHLEGKWAEGQIVKVKGVRIVALNGFGVFETRGYRLEDAVGGIELTGARVGGIATGLVLGFGRTPEHLGPPRFLLSKEEALGTMSLPAESFAAFMAVAASPNAHFRIGGDGAVNALGYDVPSLHIGTY